MDTFRPRHTRRDFARMIGFSALALPAALAFQEADAIGWCRRDPIFSLDRKVGHIYLAVPDGMAHLNNSSTDVKIVHPRSCATKLIWVDPVGFGTGQGISCNFDEDSDLQKTTAGYQIDIWVKVPMKDSSVPILVEFAPAPGEVITASTQGLANRWFRLRALLP